MKNPCPKTDQEKEDSSFLNMEFHFSKDKFEFSDEEFVAEPPKRLGPGAIIFTAKQLWPKTARTGSSSSEASIKAMLSRIK